MQAILWGREHVELGAVAVEPAGTRFAVALSRGGRPKGYGYVDDNEDVAVAVSGPRAGLLAVADGHNGTEAAEAAVSSVLEALGADPPPADLSDEELVEVFGSATEAVRRATSGQPSPRDASRTTLTVALVTAERLQWAGMGDSALVVARAGALPRLTELSVPRSVFVGGPRTRVEIAGRLPRGHVRLAPDEWVVLVTDGFTSFAPLEDLGALLASADDAPAAARAVVDHACAKGAGDNVAVALAAPPALIEA